MGRFVLFIACMLASMAGASAPAAAGRLEAGSFIAHDTSLNPNPVRINFQEPFDNVPVVIALIGNDAIESAKIRITNVTTTGFDELMLESDNFNGGHGAELIHYFAIEPGRHTLPDGSVVEAGTSLISAVQHGAGVAGAQVWATVSFSAPLPVTPAVVTHLQSANSETRNVASETSQPFITSAHQRETVTGFHVALERSEARNGPIPSAETVGWVAFPGGGSASLFDTAGNPVTWSAVRSPRITNHNCTNNALGQTSASAIAVAKKSSRFGADGGWIRRCSLSSTSIGLRMEEDTARDTERNHTTEQTSIIAFSRPFHASLNTTKLSVTLTTVSFNDGAGGDFAVPNAMVEYLFNVQNVGNTPPDGGSIVVTESLPSDLALDISDFSTPGSGPILFQDGNPSSALSCTFIALSSPTDCFAFSTDGLNYNYTPVDSGDGTDPGVTHIRITPAGTMSANSDGTNPPSFQLKLRARIQ